MKSMRAVQYLTLMLLVMFFVGVIDAQSKLKNDDPEFIYDKKRHRTTIIYKDGRTINANGKWDARDLKRFERKMNRLEDELKNLEIDLSGLERLEDLEIDLSGLEALEDLDFDFDFDEMDYEFDNLDLLFDDLEYALDNFDFEHDMTVLEYDLEHLELPLINIPEFNIHVPAFGTERLIDKNIENILENIKIHDLRNSRRFRNSDLKNSDKKSVKEIRKKKIVQ